MAICRPVLLSNCIEGKACVPVRSNSYYNEFVLATSGTASTLATPVEAALEVATLTARTSRGTSAALCIQRRWSWAFRSKTPSFAASGEILPQNATSAAMIQLGGWQKVLERSIKDKVKRPGRNSLDKRTFGATSTSKSS